MRQVVLDTETTGLSTAEGHRIIEIGCIELVNRKPTGKHYHQYINPQRLIDADAMAVHGITNESLADKPVFAKICAEFMAFVDGAELIIHNAPFDIGFINYELSLLRGPYKLVTDHCSVLDSLVMAKQKHVGQRNSLDALCKRYFIDNSKRDYHGALLDADLLARVYLAMTGGQAAMMLFDESAVANQEALNAAEGLSVIKRKVVLPVIKATDDELAENDKILQAMLKKGSCMWLESAEEVVIQ